MITRRTLLLSAPAIATASALPAIAAPAEPGPFDLQAWLDTAPAPAVVLYHLTQLTELLQRQHGGRWHGHQLTDTKAVMCHQADPNGDGTYIFPRGR